MNKRIGLILGCAMMVLLNCHWINAQPLSDNKEGARMFVQKFYDWYGKLDTANIPGSKAPGPFEQTLTHKPAYLSDKLLKALLADRKAQEKSPGEIVGLDFDPFINAQDTRSGYETGLVWQKKACFFVDVHDIKNGQPKQAILKADLVATAEVAKVDGRWVFANIWYPKADGSYSLLQILENLRKERAKSAKEKS